MSETGVKSRAPKMCKPITTTTDPSKIPAPNVLGIWYLLVELQCGSFGFSAA